MDALSQRKLQKSQYSSRAIIAHTITNPWRPLPRLKPEGLRWPDSRQTVTTQAKSWGPHFRLRTIRSSLLLEERAVQPFYLEMMGLNALHLSFGLWPELVTEAKAVTLDDAKWLLPRGCMAAGCDGRLVQRPIPSRRDRPELRRAMAVSQGSLTAPPLAVACVVVSGIDAAPEMRQYVEADPGRRSVELCGSRH